MKYYIKIICGFRPDQEYTVPLQEAHKAYYLFRNPDKQGIFTNGIGIKGSMIQAIKPDWHTTMGWNETHQLNNDDWQQLKDTGVEEKMKQIMYEAKKIADLGNENHIKLKLQDVKKIVSLENPKLENTTVENEVKELADKMKNGNK